MLPTARTGQFTTINGLTIGNGNQFTPTYNATNLTLNVTAAPPVPAPLAIDTDGDGFPDAQELLAGTDPFDAASFLRISALEKTAAGLKVQFDTFAGRTYRIEYTDDLTTNQWRTLTETIAGDGNAVIVTDPAAATRPQRFYRLVVGP